MRHPKARIYYMGREILGWVHCIVGVFPEIARYFKKKKALIGLQNLTAKYIQQQYVTKFTNNEVMLKESKTQLRSNAFVL